MQISQRFCEQINRRLGSLSYEFEDTPDRQTLSIQPYEPIYFSPKAGGPVKGGSKKWILKKHKSGQIHEPGMIAAIETIRLSKPFILLEFDSPQAVNSFRNLVSGVSSSTITACPAVALFIQL